MTEYCRVFAEVIRERLPALIVVSENMFVYKGGMKVLFPEKIKVIRAWTWSHDTSYLTVAFENLNRDALEHDVITSITPYGKCHKGIFRVIGQNGAVEMIPIDLFRFCEESTLFSGEIQVKSATIAWSLAHMLADATTSPTLKKAHLFMLGRTALPVPTKNMWVRPTKRAPPVPARDMWVRHTKRRTA